MDNAALARYRDRLIDLEQEKRGRSEDIRDIRQEMKSAGCFSSEIAGVMLAVRRHFEDSNKRNAREAAEQLADALGALAETPLGKAAIKAAA